MLCLKLLKRFKNVSVYTATQSILFFFSAIYAEFKSVFCCFAAVAFSVHSKPTDRSVGYNYSNIFHIYIQGFSQKFLIMFTLFFSNISRLIQMVKIRFAATDKMSL